MTKTKFPRGTKFDEAYPEVVDNHWDYDSNDYLPNEITYGASRKKASLICENGHSFEISPSSLSKGHGIKLIRVPYWGFNNIHDILFDNLS